MAGCYAVLKGKQKQKAAGASVDFFFQTPFSFKELDGVFFASSTAGRWRLQVHLPERAPLLRGRVHAANAAGCLPGRRVRRSHWRGASRECAPRPGGTGEFRGIWREARRVPLCSVLVSSILGPVVLLLSPFLGEGSEPY